MRRSDSPTLIYKLSEHATNFSMMLGQWPSWMPPVAAISDPRGKIKNTLGDSMPMESGLNASILCVSWAAGFPTLPDLPTGVAGLVHPGYQQEWGKASYGPSAFTQVARYKCLFWRGRRLYLMSVCVRVSL